MNAFAALEKRLFAGLSHILLFEFLHLGIAENTSLRPYIWTVH